MMLLWTLLHNVMAHEVIMSSQEDNKQFVDTIASPSYSVSITTLPGEGITNTRNKIKKPDDVSLKGLVNLQKYFKLFMI